MDLQDALKALEDLSQEINRYNVSPSTILEELSSFVNSGLDDVIGGIEEGLEDIERLEKEVDDLKGEVEDLESRVS